MRSIRLADCSETVVSQRYFQPVKLGDMFRCIRRNGFRLDRLMQLKLLRHQNFTLRTKE